MSLSQLTFIFLRGIDTTKRINFPVIDGSSLSFTHLRLRWIRLSCFNGPSHHEPHARYRSVRTDLYVTCVSTVNLATVGQYHCSHQPILVDSHSYISLEDIQHIPSLTHTHTHTNIYRHECINLEDIQRPSSRCHR